MVRLEEVFTVPTAIQEAFAYVAAFENIEDWDPGVQSSSKRDDLPPHVGQEFDLVTLFKGNASDMVYEITELSAPARVVIRGVGDTVVSVDTLTFRDVADGTEITYVAELTFTGWLRLVERPLRASLNDLGRAGANGLKAALS